MNGSCTLALGALALATGAVGVAAEPAQFTYAEIDANGPPKIWGKGKGDLNGDGRIDFLIGSHSTAMPGLYWYRNPVWTRATISAEAIVRTDIEVVDLNRDGLQDVVAATDTAGVSGITWFEQTENGWIPHVIVVGIRLHDVEVRDLDGDRRHDIVGRGTSSTGNALHLWRQNTPEDWVYDRIDLPAENGDGLRVAHVDAGNKLDIVLPRYWFRNDSTRGALAFTRFTYNSGVAANAVVAVGRIDSDGLADILVAPAHRAGSFHRLSWFRQPAEPTRTVWPETIIEPNVESDVHFAAIGDFDRDGSLDIATAMTELTANPRIKLYYNLTGEGTFAPPTVVAEISSHSMRVIDIDRDGRLSLFGADYNRTVKTSVRLWRQTSTRAAAAPAPADARLASSSIAVTDRGLPALIDGAGATAWETVYPPLRADSICGATEPEPWWASTRLHAALRHLGIG